jgi:hypothetical protein
MITLLIKTLSTFCDINTQEEKEMVRIIGHCGRRREEKATGSTRLLVEECSISAQCLNMRRFHLVSSRKKGE